MTQNESKQEPQEKKDQEANYFKSRLEESILKIIQNYKNLVIETFQLEETVNNLKVSQMT